jgi:hypothetical protein
MIGLQTCSPHSQALMMARLLEPCMFYANVESLYTSFDSCVWNESPGTDQKTSSNTFLAECACFLSFSVSLFLFLYFFLILFIYLFISFFFYYSYVHTRLGSFLPPAPTPSLTTHSTPSRSPPQYPAETILPLSLILL